MVPWFSWENGEDPKVYCGEITECDNTKVKAHTMPWIMSSGASICSPFRVQGRAYQRAVSQMLKMKQGIFI